MVYMHKRSDNDVTLLEKKWKLKLIIHRKDTVPFSFKFLNNAKNLFQNPLKHFCPLHHLSVKSAFLKALTCGKNFKPPYFLLRISFIIDA